MVIFSAGNLIKSVCHKKIEKDLIIFNSVNIHLWSQQMVCSILALCHTHNFVNQYLDLKFYAWGFYSRTKLISSDTKTYLAFRAYLGQWSSEKELSNYRIIFLRFKIVSVKRAFRQQTWRNIKLILSFFYKISFYKIVSWCNDLFSSLLATFLCC